MSYVLTKMTDIIEFNPRETIARKQVCKKVPMEYLQPFTRQISGFEEAPYAGGTKFRNNDTIMARITPCLENGKTAFVKGFAENEVVFGSTEYIVMRAIPGASDSVFIYYLATSPSFRDVAIKSMVGSSGRQRVQQDVLENLELVLPDYETQVRVGKVLSAFDDKIELNAQINHNLEEQAKAIYATYFPYSVDDALPDDWRKGTLGEIIDLHDSKRIPLSGNERAKMEKIYPYYGAASLMDYVNDYLFDGVFLLLGEDGTVVTDNGLPVLQYVWGKFWVNNHAHILTGKAGFSVESLLLLLKQTPVKSIVTGAVQPKISQANLKSIQIVIPPEKLLQEFNSVITPLFALIRQNSEESKRLAQLRDALLPKLMSGEIDVSEVEI